MLDNFWGGSHPSCSASPDDDEKILLKLNGFVLFEECMHRFID